MSSESSATLRMENVSPDRTSSDSSKVHKGVLDDAPWSGLISPVRVDLIPQVLASMFFNKLSRTSG